MHGDLGRTHTSSGITVGSTRTNAGLTTSQNGRLPFEVDDGNSTAMQPRAGESEFLPNVCTSRVRVFIGIHDLGVLGDPFL